MGFSRGADGKIITTICEGYCQNNSNKLCGNGCRNKIKDEIKHILTPPDKNNSEKKLTFKES